MISSQILADRERIQARFQSAKPFKHVYLADFLEPDVAECLLADFPVFDPGKAVNEYGVVGGKAVNTRLGDVSPLYRKFYDYLFTGTFLSAVSEISGIPDLVSDSAMHGGGTHENLNGQELDPHVDFNYMNGGTMHRRMNLLIYLNKGWRSEWGGAIELHSNPRDPDTNVIASFNVDFNKALLFETNEYSWHGFPRIQLPAHLAKTHSRKCISIYLYTRTRPAEEIAGPHDTFYVSRPLADRFKTGYKLTDEDVGELVANYRARDRYIECYQKLEEQLGRQLKEYKAAVAAFRGETLPISGCAKATVISKGQVWSDGWASKRLRLELRATQMLRSVDFRVAVPPTPPVSARHFVIDVEGTRTEFEMSAPGSHSIVVPISLAKDQTFSVEMECDFDFNPCALGVSVDTRDLSYMLEQIVAQPA
jgi:hypothetical protein